MRCQRPRLRHLCAVVVALALGCQTSHADLLRTDESQLELRAVQTRAFDTTEVSEMLRAVISTLQDLGFVIEEADRPMALVSGTKFHKNQRLRMTVTVRPQGDAQLLVRAGAHFALETVSDPEPYQEFFSSLGKSWFLESGRPRLSTAPPP